MLRYCGGEYSRRSQTDKQRWKMVKLYGQILLLLRHPVSHSSNKCHNLIRILFKIMLKKHLNDLMICIQLCKNIFKIACKELDKEEFSEGMRKIRSHHQFSTSQGIGTRRGILTRLRGRDLYINANLEPFSSHPVSTWGSYSADADCYSHSCSINSGEVQTQPKPY